MLRHLHSHCIIGQNIHLSVYPAEKNQHQVTNTFDVDAFFKISIYPFIQRKIRHSRQPTLEYLMHWSRYPFICLSSEESTPFFLIFTQFIHFSVYPVLNYTQVRQSPSQSLHYWSKYPFIRLSVRKNQHQVTNSFDVDAFFKISNYPFIQIRIRHNR